MVENSISHHILGVLKAFAGSRMLPSRRVGEAGRYGFLLLYSTNVQWRASYLAVSSGMRAKAWFWFLVMLVIPTSTGVRRWSKIGLEKIFERAAEMQTSRVDLGIGQHLSFEISETLLQRKDCIWTTTTKPYSFFFAVVYRWPSFNH